MLTVHSDFSISWRVHHCFASSVVWCIAMTLLVEDYTTRSKTHIVSALTMLACVVNSYFLPEKPNIPDIIMQVALTVSSITAVFIAPFIILVLLACLFTDLIFIGVCIALFFLHVLFDIEVENLLLDLLVINITTFPLTYIMCNIPKSEDRAKMTFDIHQSTRIIVLYILLPLACVYILISYVYMIHIACLWELPKGIITYLVSILMALYILVLFFSYPLYIKEENKYALFVSRYGGLCVLPLVMLMSVGIFYRISEYGITIMRFYAVLLNIWFYGIILVNTLTSSHRIKWGFISFALLFLFFSMGPWSASNCTRNSISYQLKNMVARSRAYDLHKHTLNEQKFALYFSQMGNSERNSLISSIDYLKNNYGNKAIENLFEENKEENAEIFLNVAQWQPKQDTNHENLDELDPTATNTSNPLSVDSISQQTIPDSVNMVHPMPTLYMMKGEETVDITPYKRCKSITSNFPRTQKVMHDGKETEVLSELWEDGILFPVSLLHPDNIEGERMTAFEGDGYMVQVVMIDAAYTTDSQELSISKINMNVFFKN